MSGTSVKLVIRVHLFTYPEIRTLLSNACSKEVLKKFSLRLLGISTSFFRYVKTLTRFTSFTESLCVTPCLVAPCADPPRM